MTFGGKYQTANSNDDNTINLTLSKVVSSPSFLVSIFHTKKKKKIKENTKKYVIFYISCANDALCI